MHRHGLHRIMRAAVGFALFAALAHFSLSPAAAQDDPRLAKARANGKVSWYTGISPDQMVKELVDQFKKRTGIEVSVYYGGSGQVASRLLTERKTKTFDVDVVTLGDLDLVDQLHKEGAIQPYTPPGLSVVQSAYVDKSGYWYGICFWTLALTYNNQLLGKDQAPKSWAELADPKWKGKVAIGDPARGAGGYLFLKAMVADQGWDWVAKLMQNDPFVTALAPSIEQAVANGERSVGTSVSSFASGTMKGQGPEAAAQVEALFASPMTVSVVSQAPNPEGGQLLADYLLSKDAAVLYAKYGWFSTRSDDVPAPYGFDPAAARSVKFATVPSTMTRQEYLDKFSAIVQAAKK